MGARSWAKFPLHMLIYMDRNSAEGVQRKWAALGCVKFEEVHSLVIVSFLSSSCLCFYICVAPLIDPVAFAFPCFKK